MSSNSIFAQAYTILHLCDPAQKVQAMTTFYDAHVNHQLIFDVKTPVSSEVTATLPPHLQLVPPKALVQRKLTTVQGQAALIHAIMHIEYNAIHLALDAIYRFREMPRDYYLDWLRVAREEAYHFHLLNQHLAQLGYAYGDFPAHNGLWEMAQNTGYDVLARMALVPRLLEARGLDVAPGMAERLRKAGNMTASEILGIIFHDEKTHVYVGNRWFHYLCENRGLDPLGKFEDLLKKHAGGFVRPPLHLKARRASGFSHKELLFLQQLITTS